MLYTNIETEKIKNLCKKYNFKCQDFFGDYKIITPTDTWIIKIINNKLLVLYHENKYRKNGFHYQDTFANFNQIFKYISCHEKKYLFQNKKIFRIKSLLNSIGY